MSATIHRDAGAIETTSPVFATRLASTLRTSREHADIPLRRLAKASGGAFTVSQLREIERGRFDLAGVDLPHLATLYEVDLSGILLERVPLVVDAGTGRIDTAGISRLFDPGDTDAMLVAYLKLVRELRDLRREPTIELRRDDIEVLATSLRTDAQVVLERLGELMHLTVAERRSLVLAFVTGATIFALAGGAIAVDDGEFRPDETGATTTELAAAGASSDASIPSPADARLVPTDTADAPSADTARVTTTQPGGAPDTAPASAPGLDGPPEPEAGGAARGPSSQTPPSVAPAPGLDVPAGGETSGPMPEAPGGGDSVVPQPPDSSNPGPGTGSGDGAGPGDVGENGAPGGPNSEQDDPSAGQTDSPSGDESDPTGGDTGQSNGQGPDNAQGIGHGVTGEEPGSDNAPGNPADDPTEPTNDQDDTTGGQDDTTGGDTGQSNGQGPDNAQGIGHGVTGEEPGSDNAPGNPADDPTDPTNDQDDTTGGQDDTTGGDTGQSNGQGPDNAQGIGHGVTGGTPGSGSAPGRK